VYSRPTQFVSERHAPTSLFALLRQIWRAAAAQSFLLRRNKITNSKALGGNPFIAQKSLLYLNLFNRSAGFTPSAPARSVTPFTVPAIRSSPWPGVGLTVA
jgi:hypothetical protein